MIFTDEQWNEIKKASPHFESARRDYIRNAPSWLTKSVVDIYEAATGNKIPHKDFTCATCVLRIYQTIGKAYFADLKEREDALNKNTEEENGENGEKEETEGVQGETEGLHGQQEGTSEEGDPGYVPQGNVEKENSRGNKRKAKHI
jgi:hypothetical protein